MNANHILVVMQIVALWLIVGGVYWLAARRDRRAPMDDIGVWWLAVLALCATLPPIAWLLQGGVYVSIFSGRLLELQPSSNEVVYLLNIALAYAASFAALYRIVSRPARAPLGGGIGRVGSAQMIAALFIVVLVKGALFTVSLTGAIEAAATYADQYRVVQQAPLGLRQSLNLLLGLNTVATVVLLIAILQRWPRYKFWLFLFLGVSIFSFDPEGGRAGLVTGLLFVAIAWHTLVRPIRSGTWLVAGMVGMVLFFLLGFLRGLESAEYGRLWVANPGVGEFDILWGNALELLQNRNSGGLTIPVAARFGELWAFLPSQLLPFEKQSLSIWYVDTFYPEYKEAGGGLGFGALAQAVIGGGLIEALIRGACLGAVAGWLLKWYRLPSAPWWRFPVYLNLLVYSFMSLRDTTFQQVGTLLQTVLPGVALIAVLGTVLAWSVDRRPGPIPRAEDRIGAHPAA